MHLLRMLACTALLFAGLGCTPGDGTQLRDDSPPPPWEALQSFEDEPLRSVGYPMELGDWKAVKSALTSAAFSDALSAFESSPLPDDYSDRQTQKDTMIQAWKDAVETAKTGTNEELKSKIEAATIAIATLKN